MTLRLLLRGSGACVAAGLAVFGWSHSRWGPKAKASLKEFQRCSFNPPPANWTGPTFKPRLDYPAKCPRSSTAENPPWTDIDFKKEPERYMQAVLDYCFEGNVNNDFVPQKNSRRNWYHAPWMCQTAIGREPIHGLTFERPAPSGYLADTQQRVCQSWAVAMYNEEGEALTFSYVYCHVTHNQWILLY